MRVFFIKNIFRIFNYINAFSGTGNQRKKRISEHFSRFYSHVYSYCSPVYYPVATVSTIVMRGDQTPIAGWVDSTGGHLTYGCINIHKVTFKAFADSLLMTSNKY